MNNNLHTTLSAECQIGPAVCRILADISVQDLDGKFLFNISTLSQGFSFFLNRAQVVSLVRFLSSRREPGHRTDE